MRRWTAKRKLTSIAYALASIAICSMLVATALLYSNLSAPTRQQPQHLTSILLERRQHIDDDRRMPSMRSRINPADDIVAVLVFACNRPKAIRNHLDQILRLRPSAWQFPVIVTQDCADDATSEVIRSYGDQVTLIRQPDQSEFKLPPKTKKFLGYYKIARHYGWALNQTFFHFNYKYAIVTEDDIDIAPDFFEYFRATRSLLELDPTLWCVSAWNDNGKPEHIEKDPKLLYRTDFFPGIPVLGSHSNNIVQGLGWMMSAKLWQELSVIWPISFWDDWMRQPEQRRNRACIRPEVSRTAMSANGKVGVSKGLYYEKHLRHIVLNDHFVNFTALDLSYLLKLNYDVDFVKAVYQWPSITQSELRSGALNNGEKLPAGVRLTYEDKNTFKTTAKAFKLMDDFRAGVPRTAYRGVVTWMFDGTRVYLAPPASWIGYDSTWT